MREVRAQRFWLLFGTGAVIALGLHLVDGWWLDSAERVRHTTIALIVAASIGGLFWPNDHRVPRGIWVGFNTAKILVLFEIGPGNLFPIVIFIGALLSAINISIGFVVAIILVAGWKVMSGRVRRKTPQPPNA